MGGFSCRDICCCIERRNMIIYSEPLCSRRASWRGHQHWVRWSWSGVTVPEKSRGYLCEALVAMCVRRCAGWQSRCGCGAMCVCVQCPGAVCVCVRPCVRVDVCGLKREVEWRSFPVQWFLLWQLSHCCLSMLATTVCPVHASCRGSCPQPTHSMLTEWSPLAPNRQQVFAMRVYDDRRQPSR